jgi:ankyrin repeat protein
LAAGADLNEATPKDGSALLVAAASGHDALAAFLAERGADANARDGKGYAALHYAASRGNMLESVKALLAHGANPSARLEKDPPGRPPEAISLIGATPLFLAAQAGNASAVRLLVASGADPKVATKNDTTPLLVAAGVGEFEDDRFVTATRNARLETAKLLVELGADVNAAGENGWTALHGAAYTGSDGIIQFLIENGAKMDAMDRFGQTPLSIAEGVITVGLGDDAVRRPRNVRQITANLLLKLGATPLAQSGVQVVVRKLQ